SSVPGPMRSRGRNKWWLGLLAFVLGAALLPACSSDDSGGDDDAEPAAATQDLSDDEQEIVDAAQAWVDDEADLDGEAKDQLEFTELTTTPAVSNVTFTQFIDGHRVVQSELVVHVLEDGTVQGANNAITDAEPGDEVEPIDEAEAEENASKAVDGTPEEVG